MKFKEIDHLRLVPLVKRPVVSLLLFPPASCTPSGFYRVEPNGAGGNKFTLIQRTDVDAREAKAWYVSVSLRARRFEEGIESPAVQEALKGAEYCSLLAEDLVLACVAE